MSANTTYNDDEEYMMLGEHCSHSQCHQRDFLPIQCDRCHQPFCKLHFSYEEHKCPFRDVVITCPLCTKLLPFAKNSLKQSEQDPQWIDRIVDEHMRNDCAVLNGQISVPKRSRQSDGVIHKCGRAKCDSEAIVQCKQCGGRYCAEHRIDGDHVCEPKLARPSLITTASNAINDALARNGGSKNDGTSRGFTSAEVLKAKYGKKSTSRLGTTRGNDYRSMNRKLGDLHRQGMLVREGKKDITTKTQVQLPSPQVASQEVPVSRGSSSSSSFGRDNSALWKQKFSNTKRSPVGQESISPEDRFYLSIYFPLHSSSNTSPVHMFFNRRWKVGKVLDRIAAQGKIVNNNATESDPAKRLQLFNIKRHKKLPTDRTLEDPEVFLVQGDSVILEYGDELSDEVKQAIASAAAFAQPEKNSDSGCMIA